MSTPYQERFLSGAILAVKEDGAWFYKGDLLRLDRDDGSECPYFVSLNSRERHCIFLSRLRLATSKEVATLNQSEEENNMTPFQKAGYTENTIFVRKDGERLQLNEDDGSECPYFNYAGTSNYAGVEYLADLEVVEPNVVDSNELAQTLEGIVVSLQGAREEVARLEALLKEKSAGLGITIVVGARPSVEALCQQQAVELIDTARKAWRLNRRDAVRVSAKEGEGLCLLDNYGFQEDVTYFVNRTDEDDDVHPVLLETEDRRVIGWVPIERMNLHKVS